MRRSPPLALAAPGTVMWRKEGEGGVCVMLNCP
jgi:hypothetical protein